MAELLKAIRNNDVTRVEKILKKGYAKNINEPISEVQEKVPIKTIPICLATVRGDVSVVKTLLHYGADVRACNKDWASPIHLATYKGFTEIVDLFMAQTRHRDNIKNTQDQAGDTPLHIAVKFSRVDIVDLLLTNNCNLSITNKAGLTALDVARDVRSERSEEVRASIVSKMRGNAMATQQVLPPLPDGTRKVDTYQYMPTSTFSTSNRPPVPVPAVKSNSVRTTNTPIVVPGDYDAELDLGKVLKAKEEELLDLEDDITTCEAERNKIEMDIAKLKEQLNQQCLIISKKQAVRIKLQKEVAAMEKRL